MDAELSTRIREFVAEQIAIAPSRVRPESTLFGDLGVYGDDAADLFGALERVFAIDLTDFEISRHFPPESISASAFLKGLVLSLRAGTPEQRHGVEPITVDDLARSSAVGRWSYCSSSVER